MDDSTNFQRNYSTGEVEVMGARNLSTRPSTAKAGPLRGLLPTDARRLDTVRDAFLGVYSGPAGPEAVFGEAARGASPTKRQPMAAQQFNLALAPSASETLLFGLGYFENPQEENGRPPA